MEKFWLKSYPPGVPADIDTSLYPSLTALLEDAFKIYSDRTAFVSMGKTLSYAELDELSAKLGGWFQSQGLAPGARVAIMMPNVLQYPVTIAAVLRAGYTVVNVNPLYTPRELEHQLNDSGAEAIVILENFATTLQAVIAKTRIKHVVVASMGDLLGPKGMLVNFVVRRVKKMVPAWSLPKFTRFNTAVTEGGRAGLKPVKQGPDDIAFLQYTGGTTGVAKGATLLHRNILANVLQADAWFKPARDKLAADEQFISVAALPLYHVFALTVCGLLTLRLGGMAILIANPRDLPGMIKEVKEYPISSLPAVNTLYNALVNHPDFDQLDVSRLVVSNGGGMAVQESVAKRWFEKTKTPILEGYGLSETSPIAT